MLAFSDAPYRFFDAKPSPFLIDIARTLNRHLILPGPNHRIREISLRGETSELLDAKHRGDRIMFVANHPTHSDPQALTEVQRGLGIEACFMAAYDVFLRGRLTAWCMSRMGNFSIDREGNDRKAMAAAIRTLAEGERALNIFPEGNVFLTNDRVTPFLEGAAFIALKAQASLDRNRVKIVPVSLKFTHLTTPRETVTRRMLDLGRASGYRFPKHAAENPVSAVTGLGRHILARHLRSHARAYPLNFPRLPETPESAECSHPPIHRMLAEFSENLVATLEQELEITPPPQAASYARIIKIRSRIHQLRTNPTATTTLSEGMADRAILALRIHGYLTPYLAAHPSIDRFDETVERIAEDFHSRAMPRTGPRRAIVRIHSPIDVSAALAAAGGKPKNAVSELTETLRTTVQQGIDSINRHNHAPGAALLQS